MFHVKHKKIKENGYNYAINPIKKATFIEIKPTNTDKNDRDKLPSTVYANETQAQDFIKEMMPYI